MSLKNIYEHKYKTLLIIPFIILILAFIQLGFQYATTGSLVNKGISLKGGSTITIESAVDQQELQLFLHNKFPTDDISVRTLSSAGSMIGFAIDSSVQERMEIDSILSALTEFGVDTKEYSVEVVGSSLGNSFFKQIVIAIIIAFVLMGVVVFIYFRNLGPSMAVILAAFSDIIVTMAVFNLTGLKLSSAGIAAFLMLIGYSVDSDILLSSRMLKKKELPVMGRVYSSIRTGLTMSGTTILAVLVALIFVQSEVVKQIMLILFIGLIVDLIMTYIQNVGILRIYLEKKQ